MNAKSGELVDHINGDVLDNRRENLRLANKSQNGMNRGVQSNSKSGIKGVSWHKNYNKWCAQLTFEGKRVLTTYHDNVEDAIKSYKTAANFILGHSTRNNFWQVGRYSYSSH